MIALSDSFQRLTTEWPAAEFSKSTAAKIGATAGMACPATMPIFARLLYLG